MADQHQEWLDLAKSVALEAGNIMRKYFGKKPDSHFKANNTIVTVADEEINQLVINKVMEKYLPEGTCRSPSRPGAAGMGDVYSALGAVASGCPRGRS